MIFAKPPGGFRWREEPSVSARLADAIETWPRLKQVWEDLKERLCQTAHREGTPIREEGAGFFLFEPIRDPRADLPIIRLLYQLRGDEIICHSAIFHASQE